MRTAVVLFNRDLRVHDQPALAEAVRSAERVVPLFVVDEAILDLGYAVPNRAAFLVDGLTDLRASLRDRGGDLVVRRGDPVEQALAVADQVGADAVHASADVTAVARRREARLVEAVVATRRDVVLHPGVTVVPADDLLTGSGDHDEVFTPYWRAWTAHPRRAVEAAPRRVTLPEGLDHGDLPEAADLAEGAPSPDLARRRRGRGTPAARHVGAGPPRRVRGPPRRPARRRHLPAQPPPPLRHGLAAGGGRPARVPARRPILGASAVLAGLPPPDRLPVPGPRPAGPERPRSHVDRRRSGLRGVVRGPHGHADRGRRHAPAPPGGLDAQTGRGC